jgi:O-antigen/teichoic acid export membrane protein
MTDGRSFVRNSAWNVAGLILPLAVAVVTMPLLVRGLGADRFAILTLAWAVIGYLGFFDLGLSRALTHAVALRLGANDVEEIPSIAWTALLVLFALGVLIGSLLAVASPTLIDRVLRVPAHLRGEARTTVVLLSASLPLVLSSAGMRGIMEAHQHFKLVNALRAPLTILMFVGPLLVLPFSQNLAAAVAVLVLARVIGWVVHLVFCFQRYAYLRRNARVSIQPRLIVPLLRFGGWTTVTNVASPLMAYLDRFFIAAILPIAAVAHYVTPYEAVTKLMVVPGAILGAAFPAFAATFAANREQMMQVYDRAQRLVLLLLFPVVLTIATLAHELLRFWMDNLLSSQSAIVLQWLAIGTYVNSIAYAPLTALQGAGRPDLIAKLHLIELPIYSVAIWFLAKSYGIVGVAIAWTLRGALDTGALLYVARRWLAVPIVPRPAWGWALGATLLVLVGATLVPGTMGRIIYVAVAAVAFVALVWLKLLTASERAFLMTSMPWSQTVSKSAASP